MQKRLARCSMILCLCALMLFCSSSVTRVHAEEKLDLDAAAAVAEESYETAAGFMHTVLDFELWSINKNVVTVKEAITALFVIILGFFLARSLCWLVRRRLSSSTRINANSVLIIHKLLYYFLLVCVLLFALQVLNIPLTAFTFLGGALAIGVGFGTQTIMSNFISGFIIMAERPIRVGDLVELEDRFATVEEVGVRCTRIRTADNVHILVPNSKFLDQSIINWTLSDMQVRAKVTVGVAYGSPVREVERLLLEAASAHEGIKNDPAPNVLFSEFGDNALVFNLFFWVTMENLYQRLRIASDVRFRVDEMFREAGIVIAFPQRDIHIDTLKPLDVRVVGQQGPDGT